MLAILTGNEITRGWSLNCAHISMFPIEADILRSGLANVLYTLQRVCAVGATQDTWSKHNG